MVEPVILRLAVGSLDRLVEAEEVERVVVPSGEAVGLLVNDRLVDKSVLGHNSAEGKGIPHAAQRAEVVTLGLLVLKRFTQHPIVDLRLFRAV